MLKRTPGKWKWGPYTDPNNPYVLKMRVYVEFEDTKETRAFTQPTAGDLNLMSHSPEMNNFIHDVVDELDEAFSQGVITEGLYKLHRKASALIAEIKVERDKK